MLPGLPKEAITEGRAVVPRHSVCLPRTLGYSHPYRQPNSTMIARSVAFELARDMHVIVPSRMQNNSQWGSSNPAWITLRIAKSSSLMSTSCAMPSRVLCGALMCCCAVPCPGVMSCTMLLLAVVGHGVLNALDPNSLARTSFPWDEMGPDLERHICFHHCHGQGGGWTPFLYATPPPP